MAKKSAKKKANKAPEIHISLYINALLILLACIVGIFQLGVLGSLLNGAVQVLVGKMFYVFYTYVLILTFIYVKDKTFTKIRGRAYAAFLVLLIAWTIFFAVPVDTGLKGFSVLSDYVAHIAQVFQNKTSIGGGIVGAFFYSLTSFAVDRIGSYVIVVFLNLVAVFLFIKKEWILALKQAYDEHKINQQAKAELREERRAQKEAQKEQKEARKMERERQRIANRQAKLLSQESEAMETKHRKTATFINVDDVIDANKPLFADDVVEPNEKEALPKKKEPALASASEINEANEDAKLDQQNENTDLTQMQTLHPATYEHYRLPPLRLLKGTEGKKSSRNVANANDKGKELVKILDQFGVKVELVDTHIGPSVTKFELRPENGVRVNRISSLQQDIKLGLAAKDIRIEAPVPGKNTVGIEIPNAEKTTVPLRDLMKNFPSEYEGKKLTVALGKDLMGQNVYGDLSKMPHLLIAGTTGSGKSVCVNAIISSLLMKTKPDEVQMLLIDPKKVEFTQYAEIPHLLADIVTDAQDASNALKVIIAMMDERYDLFSKSGVRNIQGYNRLVEQRDDLKKLSYIVVVIDELADLMLVSAKDVENSIQRITQLARAAGIHLIVATQRPSVDVITGVIKANIPSRIAFAVSSAVDSRTIIDQQGAEKLLGNGDMLYMPVGEQVATRVQGCFVSDEEINALCDYCSQQALPRYDDRFVNLKEIQSQYDDAGTCDDPLYEEVREFVIKSQKASTSSIQRHFSVGYPRAASLVDALEMNGVVGPSRGSKPREVFIKIEEDETQA